MKDFKNANRRHLTHSESTLKEIHPSGPFEENQDNIHSLIAPVIEDQNQGDDMDSSYYERED